MAIKYLGKNFGGWINFKTRVYYFYRVRRRWADGACLAKVWTNG